MPRDPNDHPFLWVVEPSTAPPPPWASELPPPVSKSMTIRELGDRHLAELLKQRSKSYTHVASTFRKHLYPAFGHRPITALERPELVAWAKWLTVRAPGKLAQSTVLKIVGYIAPAFEAAVTSGALLVNPVHLSRGALGDPPYPDELDEARKILKLEEFEVLLASSTLPFSRRLFYSLLLLAGLRFGEAAALTWGEYKAVEPPLPELVIRWAWNSVDKKLEPSTKSGATRHVPVHPVLAELLREARAWFVKTFDRAPKDTDLIAPRVTQRRRQAHRMESDCLKQFKRDLKRLGLRRRTLHKCRHAFITRLEECGADPRIVKRFTHPPRGDAFQRYQHFDWEPRCRALLMLRVRGPNAQLNLF